MNLNFGIREKTALLVVVMVALAAWVTPRLLYNHAKKAYEDRELVDLSDEATMRTWEIRDEIEGFRNIVAQLSLDSDFRDSGLAALVTEETTRLPQSTQVWRNYLKLVHVPAGESLASGNPTLIFPAETSIPAPAEWQPLLQKLESDSQKTQPGSVILSEIFRLEIEYEIKRDGNTKQGKKWVPAIAAGAQLNDGGGFVLGLLSLERVLSNRHLLVLLDERGDYLLHPNWGDGGGAGKSNRNTYEKILQTCTELRAKLHKKGEPLRPSVQRLAFLRAENAPELENPYFFVAGELEYSRKKEKSIGQQAEEEAQRTEFMASTRDRYRENGWRIGGLTGQDDYVKILAPSEGDLEKMQADFESSIKARFPELNISKIDWYKPIPCATVDTSLVNFKLDVLRDDGDVATTEYRVLFSGFREEFANSIAQKLSHLRRNLALVALAAGAIAFGAGLFYVRPLRRITKTAQSLADAPNEALAAKLETISNSLPVGRQDEVGGIARALRRLFSEIQANTRRLDQRVKERTQELQSAYEKLKELNKSKDTFLANVSHELRNPLGVMDGYLQFLECSDLDEEQLEDVRKSRKAGKSLLELIDDILDYQTISMQGVTLKPEEIDLQTFLGDIRDSMEILAERNEHELVFTPEGDLGKIYNDGKRLRQIILNLMGNASKFTRGGVVTLETTRVPGEGGEFIEFRVRDTGRGMTPDEQSRIFTLFYTNKKANESGVGLGLAISRELSRLMGGQITLEHSAPGVGTTFLIRVPATIAKEPTLAEQVKAIPAGSQTVLVIDDNENVREMMRRFLSKQGYEVVEAADGKQGIEYARELQPDAITLDAVMPELDGWDVLSALKSDEATCDIPVIMCTLLNKEAKGFALGADDYIVKPIDWDRFSHVLSNLTNTKEVNTILVVDDDEATRELFRRTLGTDACRILEAEHGQEALDILQSEDPDLIVLDLMMPVMDGFEFLTAFAEKPEFQTTPIIVVTAKTPTREEREILEGSVARVLRKGAGTTEELLETVHRRIGNCSPAKPPAEGDTKKS